MFYTYCLRRRLAGVVTLVSLLGACVGLIAFENFAVANGLLGSVATQLLAVVIRPLTMAICRLAVAIRFLAVAIHLLAIAILFDGCLLLLVLLL